MERWGQLAWNFEILMLFFFSIFPYEDDIEDVIFLDLVRILSSCKVMWLCFIFVGWETNVERVI